MTINTVLCSFAQASYLFLHVEGRDLGTRLLDSERKSLGTRLLDSGRKRPGYEATGLWEEEAWVRGYWMMGGRGLGTRLLDSGMKRPGYEATG